MSTLKQVLMRRDGLHESAAQELIDEARAEVRDYFLGKGGRDPEEILAEDFCLEPDYVFDLLD